MTNPEFIDPLERDVYNFVCQHQPVTRKIVRENFNIKACTAITLLEELVNKKLINRYDNCGVGSVIKYTSDNTSLIANPTLRKIGVAHLIGQSLTKDNIVKNIMDRGITNIAEIAITSGYSYSVVSRIMRKLRGGNKTIFN